MSNYPGHNIPAFDLAAAQLRSLGFDVVNPADIGRHYGIGPDSFVDTDTRKTLLLADLDALAYCDAVLLLSGWRESSGADIEARWARGFGIPSFESISDVLMFREARAA
jgi:hypothetical protein